MAPAPSRQLACTTTQQLHKTECIKLSSAVTKSISL
jgi:hypothetical protein